MSKTRYVVAAYVIDRAYGGPEEGGWWYDTGDLVRAMRVVACEDRAYRMVRRANRLLAHLQRSRRDVGSMAYGRDRLAIDVFEDIAPRSYPEHRPTYE